MKSLNKTMIIAGGLALSGVIVASLAVAGNVSHHHKKHRLFHAASIDGNGDGMLSRDEVMAHSQIRFDKLDEDGNGMISPKEFGARLTSMFSRMDTNKNGLLEGDELPRRMKKGGHHNGKRKDSHNMDDSVKTPDAAS